MNARPSHLLEQSHTSVGNFDALSASINYELDDDSLEWKAQKQHGDRNEGGVTQVSNEKTKGKDDLCKGSESSSGEYRWACTIRGETQRLKSRLDLGRNDSAERLPVAMS